MKVYLNRSPKTGPWGGGNKTVQALSDALSDNDIETVFTLDDKDIDIIFCFDPRPNEKGEWYQSFIDYKNAHNAKIIQRVGDVGSHSKPDLTGLVSQSIQISDFVIFPSDWARKAIQFKKKNYDIIPNSPKKEFFKNRFKSHSIGEKVKIATHHWSNNRLKGFEIYEKLGDFLTRTDEFSFTFIGRYNSEFKSDGIELIEPKDDKYLIENIPKYDIYLTASAYEAGANHVLEAMACGLPVVYRGNGGSIPEYCRGYGVEYDEFSDLLQSLRQIKENYNYYKKKNLSFKRSIDDTIKCYMELICNI